VELGSALEGLELIQAGTQPDVVLTDHLMPGMSGAELARLRIDHPHIQVMIISGYQGIDLIAPEVIRLGKPFRRSRSQRQCRLRANRSWSDLSLFLRARSGAASGDTAFDPHVHSSAARYGARGSGIGRGRKSAGGLDGHRLALARAAHFADQRAAAH